MNTKARNQIRPISADSAELTLYRNQRITVLADDLINLNAQVNSLIDSNYQSTNLSLADMTDKLTVNTLNLQRKVVNKLSPNQIYDETKQDSFTFIADDTFCGIRTLGIEEVALTEVNKDLVQKDLDVETKKFLWAPDNENFGAKSIAIKPILDTLDITTSDMTVTKADDTNYKLTFEKTIKDTDSSLLGYNKVTEDIQLVREVLSSQNIITKAGNIIEPSTPAIGFSKVIVPAYSSNVISTAEIAIPTSIQNVNLTVNSTLEDYCQDITESSSTNWTAGDDVLGTRTVGNYQQVLGTYMLTLPNACTVNPSTISSTSTFTPENNTITYTTELSDENNYYTVVTDDSNKALAGVKIPNVKVISQVSIGKETLSSLMSQGAGSLTIQAGTNTDNTVFKQVTVSYESQITYGNYLDLINITTEGGNISLAVADDNPIEYTITPGSTNSIYSHVSKLPGLADSTIYAFNSQDPYLYFKLAEGINSSTIKNYRLKVTQDIAKTTTVEGVTTYDLELDTKDTFFEDLTPDSSVELKDNSIVAIQFLPKNNSIMLYGIKKENSDGLADNYVFAPILAEPFKTFKQTNNGLLSYKFELILKSTN